MESHLQIKYSDKLPDAMHLSRDQFEKEAKLAMAVKLFEMGKLKTKFVFKGKKVLVQKNFWKPTLLPTRYIDYRMSCL